MNPQLLMSLLAMRNGGTLPIGADGTIDPSTCDPDAMLAQMGKDNPSVAAILKMMEAQKAAAATREPVLIEGAVAGVSAEDLTEMSAQLEVVRAEVNTLRARCDAVAAALGACALCWGEDASCRACRGHGAPGHCIPDQELFCEFVVPAVRLMHASRQRSNNVGSRASGTTGTAREDTTPMHFTS